MKSALRATIRAVMNGPKQSVFVGLVSFLGGPATVAYQHRKSGQAMTVALTEWWASASLGIAYLLVACALLLAWNLICAPYKEQQALVADLRAQLASARAHKDPDEDAWAELEVFARTTFDKPFALAATAAIAINAEKDWSGHPVGKVNSDQRFRVLLARMPSSVISRAASFAEAQERFVELLEEYDGLTGSIHLGPTLGTRPLHTFAEYRDWRAADPALVEAVRELVVRSGYTVLHVEVPQDWGNGRRETWPAPPQEVAG
ncbi:hypothetical protein LJR219_005048 [Phenylobacterium sp. LjRoot219]|uniref:hypothetical protein n=1 Tax=Phenylobacterium sp. LjRoot219 TaxID=3342283 RepID=UPI003ECC4312